MSRKDRMVFNSTIHLSLFAIHRYQGSVTLQCKGVFQGVEDLYPKPECATGRLPIAYAIG